MHSREVSIDTVDFARSREYAEAAKIGSSELSSVCGVVGPEDGDEGVLFEANGYGVFADLTETVVKLSAQLLYTGLTVMVRTKRVWKGEALTPPECSRHVSHTSRLAWNCTRESPLSVSSASPKMHVTTVRMAPLITASRTTPSQRMRRVR